ncbi:aminopeptidase P family N-terminal domain-containing protein [Ensifer sp. IC4062]|nr:aminopeptidase P family N-terminal domain-containing protein [Ensifer sp. IC4062]
MVVARGPQPFPRSEYLRRIALVKSEMARREIDAFVITDQHNITYLTGYTALSAYVPQGLVVSVHGEEPAFILRRQDAIAAIYQCYMERDKIIAYPEALIGNPERDGYDCIIEYLEENGLARRGIGVEANSLSVQAVEKFRKRLPAASIVDCSAAVTWIRIVKSDLEIEVMRDAAAIADTAILRERDEQPTAFGVDGMAIALSFRISALPALA